MRIARLGALFALLSSGAQSQPRTYPSWLPIPPNSIQTEVAEPGILAVRATTLATATFYGNELSKADILASVSYNGLGYSITATLLPDRCIIRVKQADPGAEVRVYCERISKDDRESLTIFTPPVSGAMPSSQVGPPSPLASSAPAVSGSEYEGPSLFLVEYEVSGTARYAAITLTNASGGSEQVTEKLPFTKSFTVPAGSQLYLSAQKTRVTRDDSQLITQRTIVLDDGIAGNVEVYIRINDVLRQQANTLSPFGVATARTVATR